MQRRQFISLLAVSSLAALLPQALFAQAEKPKPESYIAFPQGRKIVLLRPTGELLREIEPSIPEDARINYMTATQNGQVFCFQAGSGWMGDNKLAIYTVNSDGSNLQTIKPQSNLVFSMPTISPDGQSISCRSYSEQATLHVMSLDGSLRNMGESTLHVGESRFSRDGETLFFTSKSHLYQIPTVGGEAQIILRGHYPSPIDVGPQNNCIAKIPMDNTVSRLATISSDGVVTNLAGLPAVIYAGVAWSPDGRECVYTRYKSGVDAHDGGVFVTTVENPKPRQISEAYEPIHCIVWR